MCSNSFLCAKLDNCRPSHKPSSIFSSHSSTCISRLCLIITHNVSHSSSADVFGSTPSLLTRLILCSFSGFFFSAGCWQDSRAEEVTLFSISFWNSSCAWIYSSCTGAGWKPRGCRLCRLEEQGNGALADAGIAVATSTISLEGPRTSLKYPLLSLLVLAKWKYSESLAALWTTWRRCPMWS